MSSERSRLFRQDGSPAIRRRAAAINALYFSCVPNEALKDSADATSPTKDSANLSLGTFLPAIFVSRLICLETVRI